MKTHPSLLALGTLALLAFVVVVESRRFTDAEKCEAIINSFSLQESSSLASQPETLFFNQRLDHFDLQEDRTFKQQYFVDRSYTQNDPRAPIFLMLGGESPSSPSMVTSRAMSMYAKKFNALQVGLEHRYYGKSQPFDQLTTANMKWLSSQQALADAAALVAYLRTLNPNYNPPVITFGCSYSGALAAWFRMKYPQVTLASVASSAPVQAVADFKEYLEVVDKSLGYFSGPECSTTIAMATDHIQELLNSYTGRVELETKFKTCSPLADTKDTPTFLQNLMGNWQGLVQYNLIRTGSYNVSAACDRLEKNRFSGMSPYEAYVEATNFFWPPSPCFDCKYYKMVTDTQYMDGKNQSMRQWTYQTCTEFGYFQTTDSGRQPFGSGVKLQFWLDFCRDVFNRNFATVDKVSASNIMYGGAKLPTYITDNILFVNGNIDPWHSLSMTDPSPNSPLKSILVDGTSHCADSSLTGDRAPPQLQVAQSKIADTIGQWLSNYKPQ